MTEAVFQLWLWLFPLLAIATPLIAILAIVDIVRSGAHWAWIFVVIAFPIVGSIAYVVVERLLGVGAGRPSPKAAERRTARRQLDELRAQAGHWRGPHVVAEMGSCQLILGRYSDAVRSLSEAVEGVPDDPTVRYDLARALIATGERAAALPHLERLAVLAPEHEFGQAPLLHAACLDDLGRTEDAEARLRQVLERHSFLEAQVRLARLLLLRGAHDEARPLLDEVRTEAETLPRFHRRQQREWIALARRLERGRTRLVVRTPAERRRRVVLAGTLGGIAVIAVLATGAVAVAHLWRSFLGGVHEMTEWAQIEVEAREELARLDADVDPPLATALDAAVLDDGDVDRYLRLRRRLSTPARAALAHRQEWYLAWRDPERSGGAEPGAVMAMQTALVRSRAELIRELADALGEEASSPRELNRVVSLIEWRFLGREEALGHGVAEHHRERYWSDRSLLDQAQWSDDDTEGAAERAQQHEHARTRVYELTAAARSDTALSDATRQTLDRRRAELEPGSGPWLAEALAVLGSW